MVAIDSHDGDLEGVMLVSVHRRHRFDIERHRLRLCMERYASRHG